MKIMLSSKRHHYVARVSIFFIMVALIAAMVGCVGVIEFEIDPDTGEILETITFTSPDGMLTVTIPEGTIALDKDGNALLTLRVDNDPEPPAPPEDAHIIGLAYDFDPGGAAFDPAMTLTWKYSPADIPEGVDEEDLVIAYYDEAAGEWVILESVVDTATNTITASVSHFTTFAKVAVQKVNKYKLTIASTAGGAVTTPAKGTRTYPASTVVDLVATPNIGYRFVNWTGDVGTIADVNDPTTTIAMNGDYFITANFVAVYDLTIASTTGGAVTTPGEGTFIYPAGTVVSLNATPNADYRFVRWIGDVSTIANATAAITTISMNGDYSITACFEANFMVAASCGHTVGLSSNGTVVAVGWNEYGQCNIGGWTGIVQVAAGSGHTVGLSSNGTVVAVGRNDYGQCDVGNWTGIVQVCASAGGLNTVGLKSDGTVVAVGRNDYGECNVSSWTGIIQVAAGNLYTVGLKADGTVVAVGQNDYGQCNVGSWAGIIQVAASDYNTVGLRSDGAVVAVGQNNYGQCNVSGWTGIVQVAGCLHTVGLKSYGTVVTVGSNYYGQCNVTGWDLN